MNRRVTQADVAKQAGVSPTAVSLVLNGKPGVRLSDDAIARIRSAARELGYRPNLTARALSTRKSHAIGLVSDLAAVSPEASALVRGALRGARKNKYTLFIAETEGDPVLENESVEALVDRGVDGLIYAVSRSREVVIPASASRTRLVLLNASSSGSTLSILPDERAGGRSIADLVAAAGFTSGIAVIGADEPTQDSKVTLTVRRRLDGMWEGFRAHGLDPYITVSCNEWDLPSGYEAARHVLAAGRPPAIMVCMNDRLAFGVARALREAALQVPNDVSLVSFDDDAIAQYMEPQLTTVALPYVTMGELAVRLLLDESAESREHLVPMPVRIRGSVAFADAAEQQRPQTSPRSAGPA